MPPPGLGQRLLLQEEEIYSSPAQTCTDGEPRDPKSTTTTSVDVSAGALARVRPRLAGPRSHERAGRLARSWGTPGESDRALEVLAGRLGHPFTKRTWKSVEDVFDVSLKASNSTISSPPKRTPRRTRPTRLGPARRRPAGARSRRPGLLSKASVRRITLCAESEERGLAIKP